MSGAAIASLVAAALFASFHIDALPSAHGKAARVVGIGYHVALLPAIAALPAPAWVRATGYGWMLIDTVLNGAVMTGLDDDIAGSLRQGVHILAAIWVAGAGWTGGIGLTIIGSLLAAAFLVRTWLSGTAAEPGNWLRYTNAILNVAWMVAVAIALGV